MKFQNNYIFLRKDQIETIEKIREILKNLRNLKGFLEKILETFHKQGKNILMAIFLILENLNNIAVNYRNFSNLQRNERKT